MKRLIAGLGLSAAVVAPAQAWHGSLEDFRTLKANQSGPIIRIKSVKVSGWQGGGRYHTNPATYRCDTQGRCYDGWKKAGVHQTHYRPVNRAGCWQRSGRRAPATVVHRAAPGTVHSHVNRVTSERIYIQRVTRPRGNEPLVVHSAASSFAPPPPAHWNVGYRGDQRVASHVAQPVRRIVQQPRPVCNLRR